MTRPAEKGVSVAALNGWHGSDLHFNFLEKSGTEIRLQEVMGGAYRSNAYEKVNKIGVNKGMC